VSLPEVGSFLRAYTLFFPALLASTLISIAIARRVGVSLGVDRRHGLALSLSVGLILAATITPGYDALAGFAAGTGACDLTRFGLPSLNQLRPGEILLNILLYVPLGVAIAWCPPSRARLVALGLAFALPIAVEVLQLVVVNLGRECQSGDVVDNVTGLTLGIVVASGSRWVLQRRRLPGTIPPMPTLALRGLAALAVLAIASTVVLPQGATGPGPRPTLPITPASPEPPPPGRSVGVSSITELLDALANDAVGEIVVADGTYQVSPASSQESNSLWIGERFAGRTNPVLVRAQTRDRVTFDGGGSDSFGGLTFTEGSHHQRWEGFTFINGAPTETGVIVFGGYAGRDAPHHITLRNITIPASVTGRSPSASSPGLDHAIYVSQAVGGPHDLLLEDITVDGRGGLASAIVFFHSDGVNRNAWNVTVRRLRVTGTQQAIMLWDPTLRDITIDTAEISDPLSAAVTYESPGASGIVFANIISTGSGSGKGFVSSLGSEPPGVTFINNSFR
jgi:hypothetical protein